jgi:hypothetical protein
MSIGLYHIDIPSASFKGLLKASHLRILVPSVFYLSHLLFVYKKMYALRPHSMPGILLSAV